MPLVFTFGKTDSFSFDRMRDDHGGLIGISRCFDTLESGENLGEIVPIDLQATPTEAFEYSPEINPRPWIFAIATMLLVNRQNPTELLEPIPVQNCRQIAQLISRRDVQGFPNHAFLKFAIAHHHKRVKLLATQTCAKRHPQTD